MIIWLNGAFGVGKSTAARSLAERRAGVVVDPEHVGAVLRPSLDDIRPVADFQDRPSWRRVVPELVLAVAADAANGSAAGWRRAHFADYLAARAWLAIRTTVIDTSDLDRDAVVDAVANAIEDRTGRHVTSLDGA